MLRAVGTRADRPRIRWSSLSRHLTGAVAAVAIVGLALSSGGYPPAGYGVLILALALVVLVASLVADDLPLDRRGLVLVGALAGLALWQLVSVVWAATATWPVLEAERSLLYATGAAALVLVVDRTRVTTLVGGVVSGTTLVALHALATRLFPGRVGGPYEPEAGYQLAEPIGYWNALGLLLVFGLLLGTGLALHGGGAQRLAAGAALVPLAVGLYFTFSRGALVASFVGLFVLLLFERRALLGIPVLALAPAAGVLLASRSDALVRAGAPLEVAQSQGGRLALALVVLACAGAMASRAVPLVESRVQALLAGGRVAATFALGCIALAALVGVAREGGPGAAADRALAAFRSEPPPVTGSLDRRLLSVSGHGRADYWRVAARMVERAPLLGEGAGGFERRWIEERPSPNNARDAHNLYLETLAELGPLGFALLLVALVAPLTGLRRARRAALVPAALAAYAAFLVHAALDWDWELPVLVLPALACGAILVAEARSAAAIPLGPVGRGVGVAAAALAVTAALVAHVGNTALASSVDALERADTAEAAASARRAQRWAPWSYEPWQLLGEAQLAEGRDGAARRSLRRAVELAPDEWRPWFDLAIVSDGAERRRAITQARELNPLGPEILDIDGR